MKKLAVVAAVATLLWLFSQCMVWAEEVQKAEWKGKIETVDGVKVVHNPRAPLYGDVQLDLAEDLSIGRSRTVRMASPAR